MALLAGLGPGVGRSRSLEELLAELRTSAWVKGEPRAAYATGFEPLDEVLDGGFSPQNLTLVGGQPGVGKTIATLQWATHMAAQGASVVYACYEHDEETLLTRLLLQEIGSLARPIDSGRLPALRAAVREWADGTRSFAELLAEGLLVGAAFERIAAFAERLVLFRANGRETGLEQLEDLVGEMPDGPRVLFVDYLQKVPTAGIGTDMGVKVTHIAEGLKEIALNSGVAVVAVVASDHAGLTERRLRMHHLRGSAGLAYESDLVIMLNEKSRATSKVHLAFSSTRADAFKGRTVFSIEKNRSGPAQLDLEFTKDFTHYRFDPTGGFVAEQLVDETLYLE